MKSVNEKVKWIISNDLYRLCYEMFDKRTLDNLWTKTTNTNMSNITVAIYYTVYEHINKNSFKRIGV